MPIQNYTTQTNSHEGYTIEELKRLFEKPITVENLKKLISHCFNYELVSGKGIRIIELKNNDFKNNTTKTYKIECTCDGGKAEGVSYDNTQSGMHSDTVQDAIDELDRRVDILENGSGSGGDCDIDTDKGVTFDEDGSTVIADLYDYDKSGNLTIPGIYPVTLSEDGKLIVDMSESKLNVAASRKYSYYAFENSDIVGNFTFNVSITGNKISVYKIEVWINDNGAETAKEVYDDESQEVQNLNTNKTLTLKKDCSARLNVLEPDNSIARTGKIKVYYRIKDEAKTSEASATTKFIHAIYYGYTCDYRTEVGSEHISPERRQKGIEAGFDPNNNPCFKVYSNNDADYDDGKRTGIDLVKSGTNYNLTITNTEKNINYVLGYWNMDASQDGKHTERFVPSSITFKLNKLGPHFSDFGTESVFMVFFIPKCMGELTGMLSNVDNTGEYSIIDTLLPEKTTVNDYSYYNDNSRIVNLEYTAYTLINANSTDVNDKIELTCTVSKL